MKIAVALSGGIDSALSAIMLKNQGHDIIGITFRVLEAYRYSDTMQSLTDQSIGDAKKIADQYGFSHHVFDIEEGFKDIVIDPFCSEYMNGRTPNPCILCNRSIKFGRLLDYALSLGYEKIATGHYAKVHQCDNGRITVSRNKDPKKDQSYFLSMLSQDIL